MQRMILLGNDKALAKFSYNDQLSMDILATIQQYMAGVGANITPTPLGVPTLVAGYYSHDPKWTTRYGGSGHRPGQC